MGIVNAVLFSYANWNKCMRKENMGWILTLQIEHDHIHRSTREDYDSAALLRETYVNELWQNFKKLINWKKIPIHYEKQKNDFFTNKSDGVSISLP